MEKTFLEEQEERRLAQAKAYQNRKLYQALKLGCKARDRKQPIRMNPYSAVSQVRQHAAWNAGFNSRDVERGRQAKEGAAPNTQIEEKQDGDGK